MLRIVRPAAPVCAVLWLFAAGGARAQSAPPAHRAEPQEPPTFTSDTRLVVLHASVVNRSGKLLTDLPEKAFKVFENGKPQQIKRFLREDVPVSMGIIVDNSASMREKRKQVEAAAIDLVRSSNPQDEVFIVNFNDESYLDVPFTNDLKKLEAGLARIDSRGGTALRDSISGSIDYVKKKGKKDKKVLLVITDGADTASDDRDTLEKLVNKAEQSGVLVYAIGLLDEEDRHEQKKAKRVLEALSRNTGGSVFYPKSAADVDPITLGVAREIRNQYVIEYSPSIQQLDGSFREIKVTVDGPGRPTVRTRTGYYATAEVKSSTEIVEKRP